MRTANTGAQEGSSSSGNQDDHPSTGENELTRKEVHRDPRPSERRMTGFASSKPAAISLQRGHAVRHRQAEHEHGQ